MSKENTKPDFVLKHRVTGAAFLLFFGALFVPWLLGAPDAHDTSSITDNNVPVPALQKGVDRNDQLALALDEERISEDERVYISKITPLDARQLGSNKDIESSAKGESNLDSAAKKSVVPAGNNLTKEKNLSSTAKRQADSVVNKVAGDGTGVESKGTLEQAPVKQSTVAVVTEKAVAPLADKAETSAAEVSTIDVGWMVQVGVFTDKRGANRVVSDLQDKGFSPSTSIVDTNRGKNTGTRIWLGPFAQRVDAAKAKNYLTEKTGEAGFIRSYP